MIDIFFSLSLFVLWLCVYLTLRFDWTRAIRLAILMPLSVVMIWQFFSPIQIEVLASIGHPVNIGLRLATMVITFLIIWDAIRADKSKTRQQ
ncbi:hypothetical protein [Sphingopyxis sp.]|uniref:hypothetical protein n=1 Tax=Sphingopyxis sp. TaxID=1908224 RepID=UPI003D151DA2